VTRYRGEQVAFDLLRVEPGPARVVEAPASDEAVLVLLHGEIEWNGVRATRASVFDERASAVYLPPGCSVTVTAGQLSELALVTTVAARIAAPPGAVPTIVGPTDVVVHDRGEPGWRRQVYDIAVDQVPARRLLVGETVNAPGEWSSFPPHKHDGGDGEPALEEVYYYRFDRPGGFGLQGIYEADGAERAEFVRDGSVVGFARGYHPVAAAPGYRLYYLWALAGVPRRLAMHEDPAHTWLHTQH